MFTPPSCESTEGEALTLSACDRVLTSFQIEEAGEALTKLLQLLDLSNYLQLDELKLDAVRIILSLQLVRLETSELGECHSNAD